MKWDVTIYGKNYLRGEQLAQWVVTIDAPNYRAAYRQARARFPEFHYSRFRIERA